MQISAPLNSEPQPILQQIEVASFFQLPNFHIIGLPSPEVAEARERIRAAIEASGQEFPRRRVILNLSPASIRKRGTGLDLAMALAVLSIGLKRNLQIGAWGELGLDGKVKPAGQLTRSLVAAWRGNLKYFILSDEEFSLAQDILKLIEASQEFQGKAPQLVPVRSLSEAWKKVQEGKLGLPAPKFSAGKTPSQSELTPHWLLKRTQSASENGLDLTALLPLSHSLERAVGVSASGHHHLLLLGPKGTGKSHALEWLVALKPPLAPAERIRHQMIAELRTSLTQQRESSIHSRNPTIRRVSSQVRPGALMGSVTASALKPGLFSLCDGGLLIADELPEWHRDSREVFREPLERQKITLSQVQGGVELPAGFQLAATGNLCPCGGWPLQFPLPEKLADQRSQLKCNCSDTARRGYFARLSGPLLDRTDLVVFMNQIPEVSKTLDSTKDQFETLMNQVLRTREKMIRSFGKPAGLLSGAECESWLQSHPRVAEILNSPQYAASCVSLRSRHKLARLALSFALWDGQEEPQSSHFLEASLYRSERVSNQVLGLF